MTTTTALSRATKAGKKPTPVELAKRENVFRVYRDLGPSRSYKRLQVAIKDSYGQIAPRVLNQWSKEHSWQDRLRVHDDEAAKAAAVAAPNPDYDPNFDVEEALLHSAQIALTRALTANVTVSTPHQQKALIDAAINGLKAVEMRRQGRRDKGETAGQSKRITGMLEAIEERIRAALAGKPKEGEVIDVEATEVKDEVAPALPRPLEDVVEEKPEAVSEPAADEGEPVASRDAGGEVAEIPHGEGVRPLTVAERLALRKHQT